MKRLILLALLAIGIQNANAEDFTRYLLAYFTGNSVSQEQIHYAWSADGSKFTALNNGAPIMASADISLSGGVRDPFIVRGHNDGYFYMCVTDMKSSLGWSSNRGLVILRSKDLINWEHKTFHFPTLFPDEWGNVTRVWAPEIIYDVNAGKYMLYYSLLSTTLNCDKLFYSYINFDEDVDKWTIDAPKNLFCYKENGSEKATIDANILYVGDLYYMFFKTEDSEKRIRIHSCRYLTGWENYASEAVVAENPGESEEGACCFQLIGQDKWIYMSDLYGRSTATFRQRTTTDFKTFTAIGNLSGVAPRHGSVIWLTDAEYERLQAWSNLKSLLDDNSDLSSTEAYQNALTAIASGDAEQMIAAMEAFSEYLSNIDLNSILRNGNFDKNTTHWTASGRATQGGDSRNPCVEVFNSDFNFYQSLSGLQPGYYRLDAQAFQRPRSNSYGWADYLNGDTAVTTWIYMNDETQYVKNVFSEATSQAYTWGTPYTNSTGTYTPDNMATASEAFTRGMYENSLICEVTDGTLTVGIKSQGGTSSSRWSIWDNFRLTYLGTEDPSAVGTPSVLNTTEAVYNLQGQRLNTPQHGVNIILKNNKAIKVIKD